MENGTYRRPTADLDPALLAFIKWHVSSHVRWDVLQALASAPGRWRHPAELARPLQQSPGTLRATLDELVDEGIAERSPGPEGPLYRLAPDDPTTALVQRLIATATRSQELRRIIVRRILGNGALAAAPADRGATGEPPIAPGGGPLLGAPRR